MGRTRRREEELRVNVVDVAGKRFLQLRWIDPATGRPHQRSSGTTRRREAERAAARLADDIVAGLLEKRVGWMEFCQRYQVEHLASLAKNTQGMWRTASNWLEELESPKTLADVTTECLSRFKAKLLSRGLSPNTVMAYLAHLRSAMSWAKRVKLIAEMPVFEMPKRARGVSTLAQSRAIFGEEYEKLMIAAVNDRPSDYRQFQDFMAGLWHTGFRPGELYVLSWEPDGEISIDADGQYPVFRIGHDAEKAHQDRVHPMDPGFWHLISERQRRGFVFPLRSPHHGRRLSQKTVERIVSRIGKRAGVTTNPRTGKHATCTDIGRRAWASRNAGEMTPQEMQLWMRHADIRTTMKYYVHQDAQRLAEKMWRRKGDPTGDPTPLGKITEEEESS